MFLLKRSELARVIKGALSMLVTGATDIAVQEIMSSMSIYVAALNLKLAIWDRDEERLKK